MPNLIECQCTKCGVIGESRLSWSGPHIKQSCDACGFYRKFFDKALIPDVQDIKIKIWGLVNGDVNKINLVKKEIEFTENLSGLNAKLEYYKLYKSVKKIQATL